jgi:hypothetical protein
MTPAAIIRAATDGVSLALSPAGMIKAVGDQTAVNRLATSFPRAQARHPGGARGVAVPDRAVDPRGARTALSAAALADLPPEDAAYPWWRVSIVGPKALNMTLRCGRPGPCPIGAGSPGATTAPTQRWWPGCGRSPSPGCPPRARNSGGSSRRRPASWSTAPVCPVPMRRSKPPGSRRPSPETALPRWHPCGRRWRDTPLLLPQVPDRPGVDALPLVWSTHARRGQGQARGAAGGVHRFPSAPAITSPRRRASRSSASPPGTHDWSRCAGGSSRTGRRSQDPLQHLQHPLTGDRGHGLVGHVPPARSVARLTTETPSPASSASDWRTPFRGRW